MTPVKRRTREESKMKRERMKQGEWGSHQWWASLGSVSFMIGTVLPAVDFVRVPRNEAGPSMG